MTRPVVVDSSAIVALLTDAGPMGDWVAANLEGATLAAPSLAPFEAANVLRRQLLLSAIDETEASLAHQDLVELSIELWPYAALAERTWQLRADVTVYDAAYVALAELLGAPVVTLDAGLGRSAGPRCPILTP